MMRMNAAGMMKNKAENFKTDWKNSIKINSIRRNKKSRTWFSDRKQKGFLKIWLGIAIPILAFAALAGAEVLGGFLAAFILLEQLRATQNAMQAAAMIATHDPAEWEEESGKWLQLDRFNIVAAVYDSDGNEMMRSNVDLYEDSGSRDFGVFSREIYRQMLSEIEQGVLSDTPVSGIEKIDVFGYNYQYERAMIPTAQGIYWLYYGSVSAPWLKSHRAFVNMILSVAAVILLLTFLPAGYYYMLYKKRLEMEQYYRHTSSALAHDLKTPLAAISGYAQNLRENVHTEKREYYAEAIIKNIDHMSMSIEDMLELARLQNVKVKLHKEMIELQELIKEILEPLQGIIEEKGLVLAMKGSMQVCADRALIKRALGNLISNAINYTPAGENINILSENGKFQIINTGVLLTKEELKKIRMPFVKGNESRGNAAGSGIGLTIVDEIMKLHGFKWKMESDIDKREVKVTISC